MASRFSSRTSKGPNRGCIVCDCGVMADSRQTWTFGHCVKYRWVLQTYCFFWMVFYSLCPNSLRMRSMSRATFMPQCMGIQCVMVILGQSKGGFARFGLERLLQQYKMSLMRQQGLCTFSWPSLRSNFSLQSSTYYLPSAVKTRDTATLPTSQIRHQITRWHSLMVFFYFHHFSIITHSPLQRPYNKSNKGNRCKSLKFQFVSLTSSICKFPQYFKDLTKEYHKQYQCCLACKRWPCRIFVHQLATWFWYLP